MNAMNSAPESPATPAAQGILAQHQAMLDAGQWRIQHCGACKNAVYFPREVCPHCGSDQLSFVAPKGSGTVHSVTTVRRKMEAGGDYNVSIVELDEGVRLMSRVTQLAPDAVKIGQPVMARVEVVEGKGRVVFDPLADQTDQREPAQAGQAALSVTQFARILSAPAVHTPSGLQALREIGRAHV